MIEFKDVTVKYEKIVALKNASFKINEGDFVQENDVVAMID